MNGMTALTMTKLDTLTGVHPIKVCVGYKLGKKRVADFPVSRRDQLDVEPIYETYPGFSGDLSKVKTFAALPRGAREYVLAIEKKLGIPVAIVSVGQSREQTIVRHSKRLWG